jgi:hypothetical protein
MDYNPFLQRAPASPDSHKGSVEKVSEIRNMVWQNRAAPPTPYENQLGDLLEQVFVAGIEELPAVVAKLNELGGHAPDGSAWTEASFQACMRELGKE